MKKIHSFTFSAIFAVALASCTKEMPSDLSGERQSGVSEVYTFEAVQADSDTKTVIQDETAVYWSPNDSITVFCGSAKGKFVSTNKSPVATTDFTGSFDSFSGGMNIGVDPVDFWGVYPYQSDTEYYMDAVKVTVPAVQTAMEGTFAPDLFPALAKSSNTALAFYNICGGIMFTVSQTGIQSVTFKGNNNEDIAGSAKVGMDDDGKPVVITFTSGAKEITVNAPDGGSFKTGVKYYIVAYPATLSSGCSITYRKAITEGTFTSSNSITIKRSVFGKVENKDSDVTFNPIEGNITFADPVAKQACVDMFDTDSDGEVSYAEAYAATTLKDLFYNYVGVTSFEEIKYFTNVTDLEGCFYGCVKLASVTIPENITAIGENAFRGSKALETITIPSTVTSLGSKAFYGCTLIDEITVPASVTEIGSQCFSSDLKTAYMQRTTPPSIEEDSFVLGTIFYVPQSAVTLYKNARNWIEHEENIKAFIGGANCHIISSYGSASFDCTKKGNSMESVGCVASAEVLWESFGTSTAPNVGDVVSDVSYSNGKVNFTANANGNAVVAVKDANGTILWSWHIWVCKDFDPDATAQVYNNGAGTMMDRNLGATFVSKGSVKSLGLLYQWGRKDPFLSSSSISTSTVAASTITWPSTVSSSSSTGTIAYATAHPTTFITYNSSNYDWYYTGSSSTDNTRWQTSENDKGMYDPCPAGWRVPDGGDNGVWSTAFGSSSSYSSGPWDSTNKGMDFGSGNGKSSSMQLGSATTIWYPAAGYRRDDGGALYNVGSHGLYWSCTPDGHSAYNLLFYDRILFAYCFVYPSGCSYRAYGQSLRCQKEQ